MIMKDRWLGGGGVGTTFALAFWIQTKIPWM